MSRRPTGLLDELTELQVESGILPENFRDPDAPNYAEQAEAHKALDDAAAQALNDPANSNGQPVREWFRDAETDEFFEPRAGLPTHEAARYHREAERKVRDLTARDFRAFREQDEQKQKVVDELWQEFGKEAPDLARSLPPEAIEAAAKRRAQSREVEYDLSRRTDREDFVMDVALDLRDAVEKAEADQQARQQQESNEGPKSGLKDLIDFRQTVTGYR
ncbi:hypothetical protein ACFOW6_17775 [Fodinicurvata halophila]|uniref:Uncharacterized protein n=1 Tax=Fodinicurvata halophila TaxID=1419723 RepID=A0ABV8URQ1_9PROT